MKKNVSILLLFTLFTAASFEVLTPLYKRFSVNTEINLTSLKLLTENLSSIDYEEKSKLVVNKDESLFSDLDKSLKASHRMALKRFNYAPKKRNIKQIKRTENLSEFIINNEELISLHALEVPMIKTVAMTTLLNSFTLPAPNIDYIEAAKKNTSVAKMINKKEEVKQDKISLTMSSTEKLNPVEEAMINELVNNVQVEEVLKEDKKTKKSEDSDELLFFDYSKDDQKIVTETVKEMKKDIIKNVVAMAPKKKTQDKILSIEDAMRLLPPTKSSGGSVSTHLPSHAEKSPPSKDLKNEYSGVKSIMSSVKKYDYPKNAKLTIKTSLGVIGKGLLNNTTPFQFVSDVSFGDPQTSGSIGAIEIEEMINERVSTIRGTILSSDTFPTIVELPLEYGDYLINIPLLERDDVFKRFEGIPGALLLIEMDESTDSIDIDHKYHERIHLSEKFRVVDEGDDYRFILYVGVEPGNTLIQYLTLNDEVGERIVHLVEDHVFYESNTYIESTRDKIELYETKLLGKNDLELNIEENDIKYFNSDITSRSIGLNLYEMDAPILPLGMRKYLELSHLGQTIFAGYLDNKSIHLPSREYLNYVKDTFEISSLENQCLIQINFAKPIVEMKLASESHNGPIAFETLYLDKDGMFNTEATDFATKVFMIGDTSGTINLEIEYSDKSKDYFQTFCSPDTIVVEQL
ncbi:hypothetical protein A9Q84_20685 [Halobacteriovorax marinus]|mgnify:CR=1 FL=1|uniref:Uncharacterized protein n=1 Tax=Halobacteriovorax marinus TaxID=97084 RepID=A0A1Y5F1B6_9BACT|nr:hypothetical protein A9Q84_20685 [Halobacteriovorax marinus]